MKEKIKTRGEIRKLTEFLKKGNKTVVLATGCFDILHSGHIQLLQKAKALGDVLIVGANSDSSIRKIKGPRRPIVREDMRLSNLASLVPVDYVTSFKELTPAELIRETKPHVFVKGGDWRGGELPEESVIKKYGGKIVFVPVKIKTSTTVLAKEFLL